MLYQLSYTRESWPGLPARLTPSPAPTTLRASTAHTDSSASATGSSACVVPRHRPTVRWWG